MTPRLMKSEVRLPYPNVAAVRAIDPCHPMRKAPGSENMVNKQLTYW